MSCTTVFIKRGYTMKHGFYPRLLCYFSRIIWTCPQLGVPQFVDGFQWKMDGFSMENWGTSLEMDGFQWLSFKNGWFSMENGWFFKHHLFIGNHPFLATLISATPRKNQLQLADWPRSCKEKKCVRAGREHIRLPFVGSKQEYRTKVPW